MKDVRFLKNYARHNVYADSKALPKEFKIHLKIKQNGGEYLFSLLHRGIIRNTWVDHKGFPIKEKFYDNGILACCISVRRLINASGFGNQKVQKLLNLMEEAGWIVKYKDYTYKGQTVYALGTYKRKWSDALNNIAYSEILYKDQMMDQALGFDPLETDNDTYDAVLLCGNVGAYIEKNF